MNRPFTPFDIIWIKNVTNSTAGQAYMDLPSDNFLLHFPTKHERNAGSPYVGEIILLFQNINYQRVFTHLVSPTDEDVNPDYNQPNYMYGRKVNVIAATPSAELIPVETTLWDSVNFQGISMGNACRIGNIKNINNYDELLEDIWNRFAPHFR